MRPRIPLVPRWVLPILYGAVALVALVFALYVGARLVTLDDELDSTSSRLDQAERDRAALAEANAAQDQALAEANDALTDVGEAPVVVPEPADVDSEGLRGASGATGATGATGDVGPRGPRGLSITGEAGPVGKDGEAVIGPVGPKGADGQSGTDSNTPGPKGADGESIVGPVGPKGEPGNDGARGEPGAKGDPGAPGRDGTDSTTPGPAGPQGIPGVVAVTTSPACADMLPNMTISLTYDASTNTLTLVCA